MNDRQRTQLSFPDPGAAGLRLARRRVAQRLSRLRDPAHAGIPLGRRPHARTGQLAAEPADVRRPGRRHAGRRADRSGADPEVHVVGRAHRPAGSRRIVSL
ncbi:Exonuclease SbcC [Burkholderia vietnamiensis]|nr:Exonuclease SbcC [Burkholderia vietnamiensis]